MSEHATTESDAALRAVPALLPAAGVLVLDGHGRLRVVSARAVALLGFADEDALRAQWPAVRHALGLDGHLPGAATVAPMRAGVVRAEATAIDPPDGGHVIVLHAEASSDPHRHMLVQASRCGVQQHVLGGLLHDLNGPLNTIALTLALVSSLVGRQLAADPDDALALRVARHVAMLEAEARRLGASSQSMSSVLHAEEGDAQTFALGELIEEARRQLRHHATLHDIALEHVGDGGGALVHTAREPLRFALLALLLSACAMCDRGGRVVVSGFCRGDDAVVDIAARPAVLPAAARAAFDAPLVSPASEWLHLAAGRLVVTRTGGTVDLVARNADEVAIEIAMHAAG